MHFPRLEKKSFKRNVWPSGLLVEKKGINVTTCMSSERDQAEILGTKN